MGLEILLLFSFHKWWWTFNYGVFNFELFVLVFLKILCLINLLKDFWLHVSPSDSHYKIMMFHHWQLTQGFISIGRVPYPYVVIKPNQDFNPNRTSDIFMKCFPGNIQLLLLKRMHITVRNIDWMRWDFSNHVYVMFISIKK